MSSDTDRSTEQAPQASVRGPDRSTHVPSEALGEGDVHPDPKSGSWARPGAMHGRQGISAVIVWRKYLTACAPANISDTQGNFARGCFLALLTSCAWQGFAIVGAALCLIGGFLAASTLHAPDSKLLSPVSCDSPQCLQTLPNVLGVTINLFGEPLG